jgi:excisionase family DNA binding protein
MKAPMNQEPLTVDTREAARRLGISRRLVQLFIARGELKSRKLGRRRLIPLKALQNFLRRDHPTKPQARG